jgi:hypothetical protein
MRVRNVNFSEQIRTGMVVIIRTACGHMVDGEHDMNSQHKHKTSLNSAACLAAKYSQSSKPSMMGRSMNINLSQKVVQSCKPHSTGR